MNFRQSALAISISALFLPGMVVADGSVGNGGGSSITGKEVVIVAGDKVSIDDSSVVSGEKVTIVSDAAATTPPAKPKEKATVTKDEAGNIIEISNTAGKVVINPDTKSQQYKKANTDGTFTDIMTVRASEHGNDPKRVKLGEDGKTIIVLSGSGVPAKVFDENGAVNITREKTGSLVTVTNAQNEEVRVPGPTVEKNTYLFGNTNSVKPVQLITDADYPVINRIKVNNNDAILAQKAIPKGAAEGTMPETLVFDDKGSAHFAPTANTWDFKNVNNVPQGKVVIDSANNKTSFHDKANKLVKETTVKDTHTVTVVGGSEKNPQPITDENRVSIYKDKKGTVLARSNKDGSMQIDPETSDRTYRDTAGKEVDKAEAIEKLAAAAVGANGNPVALQEYTRYLAEQGYGASRTYTNTEVEKAKTEVTTGYTRQVDTLGGRVDNLGGRVDNLSKKVDDNEKKAKAGIAGAMAMSAIPQRYGYDFSFGMGVATYGGEQSVAAGAYYNISSNTTLSVKASVDTQDDVGGAVGVSFGW